MESNKWLNFIATATAILFCDRIIFFFADHYQNRESKLLYISICFTIIGEYKHAIFGAQHICLLIYYDAVIFG